MLGVEASSETSAVSLHPIQALDHVTEEYQDYLLTEFRAKDPELRAALERELNTPLFLAQEPFYQAHRPFKEGRAWKDLPIDAKLAQVMEQRTHQGRAYSHQSEAIAELLYPSPRPVVVTTGTGSGKTEAFLLPAIQNAFEDSVRFAKSGLTAILVYPMNALANDQRLRIEEYLAGAGMAGAVRVEQYDRSTSQAKRDEMRKNPPHILLTNYMMLEYLLVRPADREEIFANHRCRFLVLDEVHSYRGILGSNIALLVRRLKVHLARARQDWKPEVPEAERPRRYPILVPVGTSATIKSIAEHGLSRDEVLRQRDEAVQEFFSTLTGVEKATIRVLGEELQDVSIPNEAVYPAKPGTVDAHDLNVADTETIRTALCTLAALSPETHLDEATRRYRLLWDLNRWLIRRPMSLSQLAEQLVSEVSERAGFAKSDLEKELEAALVIGAALPDGTPGALRLRAHRFVRGGWKFHRCLNPACGKLHPRGEERCSECNHLTAPLYLCRGCGADYLRIVGDIEEGTLRPSAQEDEGPEWMICQPQKFDTVAEDDDEEEAEEETTPPRRANRVPEQIRRRPVLDGSLDAANLRFSTNSDDFPLQVTLVPARTRCICCGGTAGSRNVISPVSLGTSAAVKVLGEGLTETLAEANRDRPNHDGKERLLVFSDSRQDAAHQARFIIFSSRYDRLRRRLVKLLHQEGSLDIQRAVELLGNEAVEIGDSPRAPDDTDWIQEADKIRIRAWEEAPLLDEIAVNAGYRATLFNLGLASITYHSLGDYARAKGQELAENLGIPLDSLEYLCVSILDEIRTRGALSREMLRYHPSHPAYPEHLKQAEWERKIKAPQGYAAGADGNPIAFREAAETPGGIKCHNAWRRPRGGGRSPSLERILRHLVTHFGGPEPDAERMVQILTFLKRGGFLVPVELFGARQSVRLLQVNADAIRLESTTEESRRRCNVCGFVRSSVPVKMPCPRCHGQLGPWPDRDVVTNRWVKLITKPEYIPLVAGEHTAQITTADRAVLEEDFKAPGDESPINLLACSPTLEMGIDVGGLDAVVMRNIPPRPDNYAQRGGRAGRRTRVGLVVSYARSTPHDQYFFDKPREMIAGEVPAPAVSLGNRDVIMRHLYAIAFGAAVPGLAGRMLEYVTATGNVNQEAVDQLIAAVSSQIDHSLSVAQEAWGSDVLDRAGLSLQQLRDTLNQLPQRIRYVLDCTALQVKELRQAIDDYSERLNHRQAAIRAGDLISRLLGIPQNQQRDTGQADDTSAGYPLRRFAEFGILPGYEFPSEPAALRLLGDKHEEDPVTVTRRFGIGQFQPDASVYARSRRWKVIGLDTASPWNQRTEGPAWNYRVCRLCKLRYHAEHPSCPRCKDAGPGQSLPGYEFAGFIAWKNESPILDEEERYAERNLVRTYPQWDGKVVARWSVGTHWALQLSQNEEVRWVNEGRPPLPREINEGVPMLHADGKGYLLCPTCGHMLTAQQPPAQNQNRGRQRARGNQNQAAGTNGHNANCAQRGAAPQPLAIATQSRAEILRLLVPVPTNEERWQSWGLSLGYALLNGMQHSFMLGANEIDFELEGPWTRGEEDRRYTLLSLAFIDPSLGGSGYLKRIAEDFHRVAARAKEHLEHEDCETACYRCLKTYYNQRFHDLLAWPQTLAALEELAVAPPQAQPLEPGDLQDPTPWLEAFAAGVGSPLELRFLRLFETHGFQPQKQVPVAPAPDKLPISVADFAVPERRLAIYIDGAAFHTGDRLRRDRFIRPRLREGNPPWRVEELRAADLGQGRALVEKLKAE
jgi:replicative superfamily II helicase